MISIELNSVFSQAVEYAKKKHHEYLTVEHVFWSILQSSEGRELLRSLGVDTGVLSSEVLAQIDRTVPILSEAGDPIETVALSQVINDMMNHLHASAQREATIGDMLAALSDQKGSYVVFLLHQTGVERLDILEAIAHPLHEETPSKEKEKSPHPNLDKFTIELVAMARTGKIDPVIGREEEIERLMQTLVRRKKNNPLLVGEPGVGKTAIAEGLALGIAEGTVPEILEHARIYALEMGALVAGTKFRGDFEKRLKGVIDELKALPDAIIFIDEIHTLVGAGSTGGGSMDASNILKPALARGDIRCIGATTYGEYRNFFDKDKALSRRFAKVDVPEPSVEDTYKILKGVQHKYEAHHEIAFSDKALRSAIDLSVRYIHDRFLPDKAMDIIDEAGAHFMLHGKKHMEITSQEIARSVARMLKLPDSTIDVDDTAMLATLEADIGKRIIGQDEAITALVRSIKRAYAGLNRENTPVGSFLFVGPTGVGKTALATALAETMEIHFERLDMSEYMEPHAVSRLIGAPPGYVGFEQGGLLTEMIKKHPHTVLLLDEIEKAHPDIMNILLQVMDGAKLTDNNGVVSDFKHVILIMTSNIGTKEANVMGFANDSSQKTERALKEFFTPEFRNRLSATIAFKPLSKKALVKIVEIELGRLNDLLASKNITVKLTKQAKRYLAKEGYDERYGARHIARVIDDQVKEPLTDEILFGALKDGGGVKVDCVDERLTFSFQRI
jgi:ATP-dependent Clp protease ATP-binding subunit ClpA